jgi:hypothetical protein
MVLAGYIEVAAGGEIILVEVNMANSKTFSMVTPPYHKEKSIKNAEMA